MTTRGFNIGVITQPPTGGINGLPRKPRATVPFTNMPGRPVDSTLYMTSAAKKSTATIWAEDFRTAERRMDQEDAMEKQRIKEAGNVVPPQSIQTVKNVNVVNMPNIEEMVRRGANTGAGISGQPPSNDFPGNPPTTDGGSKRNCSNTYGGGYGGGSGFPPGGGGRGGFGGTFPGAFPDIIVEKKNVKSEDVASINPLSKELTLTDWDTIMGDVEKVTTKTETKAEVKEVNGCQSSIIFAEQRKVGEK
ncbi:hypothetical protein HK097_008122 [Rhizophlyctis rosea]|uniref:Uncharacterized protein n=1 Tax=Rhizophlyctis rosea TaxID=64517 RepID=A0AAD5X1V6_9FUNG|nr:hypothetical protein HK097_008122 [Rhizophlyctis rosea]